MLESKLRTVRVVKLIGHNSHSTGVRVETVHLILQTRGRAEILHIAVDGISEVNFFVLWVDSHIVQRVELTTKVVVEDNCQLEIFISLQQCAGRDRSIPVEL